MSNPEPVELIRADHQMRRGRSPDAFLGAAVLVPLGTARIVEHETYASLYSTRRAALPLNWLTLAINCFDEQQLTTTETTAIVDRVNEVAPFGNPGIDVRSVYGCEGWPQSVALDIPYGNHAQGLPETLVISVTGDGLTPHEGGLALAESLEARLLTVEGEQHGTIATRNPCIDDIVGDYLVELKLPGDGARCTI